MEYYINNITLYNLIFVTINIIQISYNLKLLFFGGCLSKTIHTCQSVYDHDLLLRLFKSSRDLIIWRTFQHGPHNLFGLGLSCFCKTNFFFKSLGQNSIKNLAL